MRLKCVSCFVSWKRQSTMSTSMGPLRSCMRSEQNAFQLEERTARNAEIMHSC